MRRVAALLFALLGCQDAAEQVADRFVAAYFVEASQDQALRFATGLARQKLVDELRLVQDVRSRGYTPDQARAEVRFSRRTFRPGPHQAQAGYDITIESGGSAIHSMARRSAYLSLRLEPEGWRVSNFQVSETVSPRGANERP